MPALSYHRRYQQGSTSALPHRFRRSSTVKGRSGTCVPRCHWQRRSIATEYPAQLYDLAGGAEAEDRTSLLRDAFGKEPGERWRDGQEWVSAG